LDVAALPNRVEQPVQLGMLGGQRWRDAAAPQHDLIALRPGAIS
jgi:hypothetical protein